MRAFPVVAIIDDNDLFREGLASLVMAAAYRVESYASAEAFLAQAPLSEASCLVLDMQLETTSGLALAHELVRLGFAYPIIFMTGSLDPVMRAEAMTFGCIAYLHKPFALQPLLDAIARAVNRY